MHKFDDIVPPSRPKDSVAPNPSFVPQSRKSRFPYVTVIVALLVIAGSIGALVYFSSASIEIVPNSVTAAVENTYTAGGDAALSYKVITAQKIATQSIKGTGTKNVTSNASGTITIYNTQSKPQPLITKTRFATNAGLIYRIQAPVTVPAGSAANPGTVTARVIADQPGSSYNIGPSSFTLPGLAGTPQATEVYARSTSPMSGGASGPVPTVNVADEVEARAALATALAGDIEKALVEQIPSGYVLLPGAATTSYQSLDSTPSATEGEVDIKEQGTMTAVIFPNAALTREIAQSIAGLNYQGEPLELVTPEQLTLSVTGSLPVDESSEFSFRIAGTAPIVYQVDTNRIAAAVAGKTRSAAEVALTNYPEVSRAVIVLRPFWKQSFPEDPASIAVRVLSPTIE